VRLGEAFNLSGIVLHDARAKITRHAGVEGACDAGDNVNPIPVFVFHGEGWLAQTFTRRCLVSAFMRQASSGFLSRRRVRSGGARIDRGGEESPGAPSSRDVAGSSIQQSAVSSQQSAKAKSKIETGHLPRRHRGTEESPGSPSSPRWPRKRKIPHPYARAEDCARSLTGIRDDESKSVSREFPVAAWLTTSILGVPLSPSRALRQRPERVRGSPGAGIKSLTWMQIWGLA
jgi:hypothetical protein